MASRKEQQNPIEAFLQRHGENLIHVAAAHEAHLTEVRQFMAWLQEKTGWKPKVRANTRTKFDRERWEEFHASNPIYFGRRGREFEEKRKAALERVGKVGKK